MLLSENIKELKEKPVPRGPLKMDFLFLFLIIHRKGKTEEIPSYLKFKYIASNCISWNIFTYFHYALLEQWLK